jgi:DNA polymerase-3 subunit beta
MFEFSVPKHELLTPLLTVFSAIGKKPDKPVLSHILMTLSANELVLTATDLEIEMTARVVCTGVESTGSITVPGKKMVDIIRCLDDDATPNFQLSDDILFIKAGRSLFKLATLPATHFPQTDNESSELELVLPTQQLITLLQSTHFALSQHDVRVFLNCLLLELDGSHLLAVGTDGHRMAIARLPLTQTHPPQRLLVPRKAIQEILRLAQLMADEQVTLFAGKKHLKLVAQHYIFSSKLVEARFPVYAKAIPVGQNKYVLVDKEQLKRALSRIVILANEKLRAILLHLQAGLLTLIANNQEKEEAIETLEVETHGDELRIGINAAYLLDVLPCIPDGLVRLSFSTTDSSILLESPADSLYQYIIMPMKL